MKPVFDENGLATEPGEIRCFYYDGVTGEYTGWSDEYIHEGVSMPGYSTDIDPGDEIPGKVAVFTGGAWIQQEDHRGTVVYSTADGLESIVDYIGEIKPGFTQLMPATLFDKWDGEKWVTDINAQHVAEVEAAEQQKSVQLLFAKEKIILWQTELQLGIISDEDKEKLISWVNYIKAVQAVDTQKAHNIIWPKKPFI